MMLCDGKSGWSESPWPEELETADSAAATKVFTTNRIMLPFMTVRYITASDARINFTLMRTILENGAVDAICLIRRPNQA